MSTINLYCRYSGNCHNLCLYTANHTFKRMMQHNTDQHNWKLENLTYEISTVRGPRFNISHCSPLLRTYKHPVWLQWQPYFHHGTHNSKWWAKWSGKRTAMATCCAEVSMNLNGHSRTVKCGSTVDVAHSPISSTLISDNSFLHTVVDTISTFSIQTIIHGINKN